MATPASPSDPGPSSGPSKDKDKDASAKSPKPKPWSRNDVPDLKGKIVIVTGGAGGVGYETSLCLAKAGAEVVLAGSNEERGKQAVERIKASHSEAKVSYIKLDLGSLASIGEFAKAFNARRVALDILVNNAGISQENERKTTVDGFERTFGVNHLGHFALTAQLLPSLKKSSSPRIVVLTSKMAQYGRIEFDDLQSERKRGHRVYSDSKLANLLFAFELQRKSDENNWGLTVIPAHPGLVKTEMTTVRPGDPLFKRVVAVTLLPFAQQPLDGANSSLFAATSPEAKHGEHYYGPSGFFNMKGSVGKINAPRTAMDKEVAKKLWTVSEELTKVTWA